MLNNFVAAGFCFMLWASVLVVPARLLIASSDSALRRLARLSGASSCLANACCWLAWAAGLSSAEGLRRQYGCDAGPCTPGDAPAWHRMLILADDHWRPLLTTIALASLISTATALTLGARATVEYRRRVSTAPESRLISASSA